MTISQFARPLKGYAALFSVTQRMELAYGSWVWLDLLLKFMTTAISIFFWRGIYQQTASIQDINLQQMLAYAVLSQTIVVNVKGMVFDMGVLLREGMIGIELLRPVDFQTSSLVQALSRFLLATALRLPLLLAIVLLFGIQLTTDPNTWLVFSISLFLGFIVWFFFDWIFACMVFYTTDAWGLAVLYNSIVIFFSGSLVPLKLLPPWLQQVAGALPFAQSVYAPLSLLTGIVSPADAPAIWFQQIIWIIILAILSRLLFRVSIRKVTIQGG